MSEVSQGPGWWLASDGRWYPPEQAPGYAAPVGMPQGGADPGQTFGAAEASPPGYPPTGAPGFGPPTGPPIGPPGYPPPDDPGFGPPPGPPGYAPPVNPGYGYPPAGPLYGYVPAQKTNGLAVASLICSIVWMGGLGSILAVIFGFIARGQVKKSEGTVQGNGLALAGIIIGFVGLAFVIFFVIFVVAVVHHCDQTGSCTTNTYNFGN